MKFMCVILMVCCVGASLAMPEEEKKSMESVFRVIPHDGFFFLCRGVNKTDKAIRLDNACSLFSNNNSLGYFDLSQNHPNSKSMVVLDTDGLEPIYLQISPKEKYLRYVTQKDKSEWFSSFMVGYLQMKWFFWGDFPPIYVGFPDKNGEVKLPIVDRPLRHHTRKDQIALAYVFRPDRSDDELGFLVMNKLDEPFTAVKPLSARSRIIATSPAINYRRELFLPDKDIVELAVPSGEVAEWRLLWKDVLSLIPKEDLDKIIAGGGDLDLTWKLDEEESPVLPMHIAPSETFKDSRIIPHPELEDIRIIADPAAKVEDDDEKAGKGDADWKDVWDD